jgi:short-subunit dehydrogenase
MKNLIEKYGPWALITGASAGIGEAFAHALAEKGFNLIVIARRKDKLISLKGELEKSFPIEVLPVELDLSQSDFLPMLIKKTGEREVNLLVNNAGFGINSYFLDTDPARDREMVMVNCLAPLALTHHFARAMAQRRRGAIIFLSSIGANQPTPKNTTYCATKVFNLFLGESLSFELKEHGIDVLTVMPGATRTEFQKVGDYSYKKGMRSPKDVVCTALRALGKKISVTDGLQNTLLAFFARRLPRKWSIRAAGAYIKRYSPEEK